MICVAVIRSCNIDNHEFNFECYCTITEVSSFLRCFNRGNFPCVQAPVGA